MFNNGLFDPLNILAPFWRFANVYLLCVPYVPDEFFTIADTIHFRTAYKKIVRLFIKKYEQKYLKSKKISEEFKTILCFHIVKKQES